MSSQSLLLILGVVVLVALAIVVVFAMMGRRTTHGSKSIPESQQWIAQAKIEAGERESSPASEEIEQRVRNKLAAYPDLAHVKLDFASATDGSLEIWVDETHYHSITEISDERLHQAIQAAVQEWNDLKGG
jgi:flagellar basal body-associated protein FliL